MIGGVIDPDGDGVAADDGDGSTELDGAVDTAGALDPAATLPAGCAHAVSVPTPRAPRPSVMHKAVR
jgi:hypothetical protein